jgi:K+-transporting ATPase ATPase C chain
MRSFSSMRSQLLAAVRVVLVLTVLTGVLYPLAVTVAAQVAFGHEADGSLVEHDGRVVGSTLIGQAFTEPGFFHGRPSAVDQSQVVSGASNLGPTNPELLDRIEDATVAYRDENGLDDDVDVPIDAVTTSGSGFDPHISVANARLQAARVAAARDLDVDDVLALVDEHTEGRSLGFLGEPGVNVLTLNLALAEYRSP